MKTLAVSLILLSPTLLPAAESGGWRNVPAATDGAEKPLPVWNTRRAALVVDSPTVTQLRGMLLSAPLPGKEAAPDPVRDRLLEAFKPGESCGLVIEWLGADPVQGFEREWHTGGGQVRSSYRIGNTTVTRTVLASAADDAIFIHLHADQPGALSFRVRIPADGVRGEDRRQLILTPEKGPTSHVWVIPFESDVEPDGRAITVRGEGEALVIWIFSPDKSGAGGLARTWARLAERHDPGHTPPDASKIWHGVLEKHLKSPENSP